MKNCNNKQVLYDLFAQSKNVRLIIYLLL